MADAHTLLWGAHVLRERFSVCVLGGGCQAPRIEVTSQMGFT